MQKKLIGFNETLLERIEEYSKKSGKNFTDSIRKLVTLGLNSLDVPEVGEPDSETPNVDISSLIERLEKLEKDMSWWNADENESKVGNLRLDHDNLRKEFDDAAKKLNIVVAVSKKFKGHLENREIHLQD